MRNMINALANMAQGKFLMKCDAHCAFAKGFDEVLTKEIGKDWVVAPRRYSLNVDAWGIEDNGKIRDAHYLSYPAAFDVKGDYLGFGMHVKDWPERGNARKDFLIDEDMTSQGSCWVMHRDYFKPLCSIGYGTFIQEMQEIGLRAWLSGGKLMVNKKTWYAHLWKGKRFGRMYELSRQISKNGEVYSADYWNNNRSPERIHDLEWLVDKFWPVPTWDAGWKDVQLTFPKVMVQAPDLPEEDIMTTVQDVSPKVTATPKTRDEVVAHILKKFNIAKIESLPIDIDYNRSQWGKLFNELGYKKGAEIGVYAGEYSECLCRDNPGVEHYCVDQWMPFGAYKESKLIEAERLARENLAKYNCKILKMSSMDAVKQFADNSLDYVYIDGGHDFQNITNDIVEWEKKVRPGGIISGHDLDKHRFSTRCHVLQVVYAYTAATGAYPWFKTSQACRTFDTDGNRWTSWLWVKA